MKKKKYTVEDWCKEISRFIEEMMPSHKVRYKKQKSNRRNRK